MTICLLPRIMNQIYTTLLYKLSKTSFLHESIKCLHYYNPKQGVNASVVEQRQFFIKMPLQGVDLFSDFPQISSQFRILGII